MRWLFVVLVALGSLAGSATPADAADGSARVTIDADTTLGPDFMGTGIFTASAPLCPTGVVVDKFRRVLPSDAGTQNLIVGKHFACGDGRGTFDVLLFVHLSFQPSFSDNFVWTVTSGTGAIAELRGFGSGTGALRPGGIIDHYLGLVRVGASD